ncbi:SCP-2 sterol transfer family protein [mine drainage metagenome]|uniref:SCP-2 sterol transfer family protein n=1 Tax=mine drainage metagenome TaxID=410659 RepID=A0A1J5QE78_9ZZZZ
MSQGGFRFPRPLGRMIEHLPSWPPSFVLSRVLDLVLNDIIRRGELQALHGKQIYIHVTDAGLHLHFSIDASGFYAIAHQSTPPDLAISATAHDFYQLATRREDSDTLFFSRRLVVEGDTELGLITKNILDGIELPNPASLHPANLLTQLRMRLRKLPHLH